VCVLLLPACIHVLNSTLAWAQLDVTITHCFVLQHVVGDSCRFVSHELELVLHQTAVRGTRRVHVNMPRLPSLHKMPPLAPCACEGGCKQPRVADRDWRSGALVLFACQKRLLLNCMVLSGSRRSLLCRDLYERSPPTRQVNSKKHRSLVRPPLQLYIIAHCIPPNNRLTAALCPMRSGRAKSRQACLDMLPALSARQGQQPRRMHPLALVLAAV
jgi:hypothetical protein